MINIVIIAALLICCSCTAPKRTGPSIALADEAKKSPSRNVVLSDTTSAGVAVPAREPSLPSPPIPPLKWKGLGFYVLPKQELLCQNGYELYSCKPGTCASGTIDSVWERSNHRIRCDRLCGVFVFIESVEPVGSEWLISFNFPKEDKKFYATTRDQAISEIALVSDLDGARRRWLGKVVFARRGVISAFGTNSGTSITSLRVDIRDSLSVTAVRWGVTPLPVKPIWLMVSSRTGKTGFIPVRFSWTNTMMHQRAEGSPWEEDLLEKSPTEIFQWDDAIWELVNNHRVVLDMTEEQVRISWGDPVATGNAFVGQDAQNVWTYSSQQLFFSAQRLVAITELPQPAQ